MRYVRGTTRWNRVGSQTISKSYQRPDFVNSSGLNKLRLWIRCREHVCCIGLSRVRVLILVAVGAAWETSSDGGLMERQKEVFKFTFTFAALFSDAGEGSRIDLAGLSTQASVLRDEGYYICTCAMKLFQHEHSCVSWLAPSRRFECPPSTPIHESPTSLGS